MNASHSRYTDTNTQLTCLLYIDDGYLYPSGGPPACLLYTTKNSHYHYLLLLELARRPASLEPMHPSTPEKTLHQLPREVAAAECERCVRGVAPTCAYTPTGQEAF